MGIAVDIRDALFDAIEAKRGAGEYVYNIFYPEKTHKPFDQRESQELSDGKVYLMAAGFDESLVNRGLLSQVNDLPILIYMQRSLPGADSLEMGDQLLNLLEEIGDTAKRIVVAGHTWSMNRQIKDESGYPFTFSMQREQSVLQVGFTAHYHKV